MNYFVINAQLPSLNEYILACRTHWTKGAAFKKRVENLIMWSIKQALMNKTLFAIDKPCIVEFEWHERTKKRDVDNIQSSQKFILDAMQKMKIIQNDNRKCVKQINHIVIDDEKDFVVIKINEVKE